MFFTFKALLPSSGLLFLVHYGKNECEIFVFCLFSLCFVNTYSSHIMFLVPDSCQTQNQMQTHQLSTHVQIITFSKFI